MISFRWMESWWINFFIGERISIFIGFFWWIVSRGGCSWSNFLFDGEEITLFGFWDLLLGREI
jgi:hypothetical protein